MRFPGGAAAALLKPALDLFLPSAAPAPAPAPIPITPLPPIPEPAVAPVADDQALKAAARRRSATVRQRSGRLSTVGSGPQGTVLG